MEHLVCFGIVNMKPLAGEHAVLYLHDYADYELEIECDNGFGNGEILTIHFDKSVICQHIDVPQNSIIKFSLRRLIIHQENGEQIYPKIENPTIYRKGKGGFFNLLWMVEL